MSLYVKDYDYDLNEDLIADQPPTVRGTSRLLVVDPLNQTLQDKHYKNIVDLLSPGDLLVLNDTKVLPARIITTKDNGAEREIILIERHAKNENWFTHKVIYRRRLNAGDTLRTKSSYQIKVRSVGGDGTAIVESNKDLLEIADIDGEMPLPPYMHRKATPDDIIRYQTVWAKNIGSVAAPTASLNMTNEILAQLKLKGINITYLTLHVGLGTFLPIRTNDLTNHKMHSEYFEIPAETVKLISETKAAGKQVVAVGTTVTRTLEFAKDRLIGNHEPITGEADIFIYPGYDFQIVDQLITNFHAPRSTVLMLTAAFCGWDFLKQAYDHATKEKYNFLSYGDSMLIQTRYQHEI